MRIENKTGNPLEGIACGFAEYCYPALAPISGQAVILVPSAMVTL